MRKLHLILDDPDPRKCVTHCGLEDHGDTLDWTYNRKKLLKHPRRCKKCIELSKPEQPPPLGFAASQLAQLEYYNQLSRNPPEVVLKGLDKIVVEHLIDGIRSATLVALTTNKDVSVILKILNRLFNDGVITKIKNRWVAHEQPIPMHFKLVDPSTMSNGRVIYRS